ncbi:MAG: hypothetical protein IKE46_11525 [Selenomonadaceae bacterium]|nr:hypothetical protein [Selenomonadaceae bacterium]
MSELVKTFFFDLQRFADIYLSSAYTEDEPKVGKYIAGPSSEAVTDSAEGNGAYYWDGEAPDWAEGLSTAAQAKVTYSVKSTETYTYTDDDDKERTGKYYLIDPDSVTKVTNLTGAEAITAGTITLTYTLGGEEPETDRRGKNDYVTFDDGELTGISITTTDGTSVAVAGADGDDFQINGGTVNVSGAGDDGYTYTYGKKTGDILNVSGGEGVEIASAGAAKTLYVPEAEEATDITIGSDTFTYLGGGAAVDEEGTISAAYFKLDGSGKVNGFMFGNPAGNEAITVPEGSNLALYYNKNNKETAVPNVPSVTGVDSFTITSVGEEAITGFTVAVEDGAELTLGSSKLSFTLEGEHDGDDATPVSVAFDLKGNITGVVGMVAGDSVEVSGMTELIVADDAEGLAEATAIEVLSGKFTYSISEDAEAAIPATITLSEDADTVKSLGDLESANIVPAAGGESLTIFKDTFEYSNASGEAYFTATGGEDAAISGFIFGGAGDALTYTKKLKSVGDDGMTLNYLVDGEPTENGITAPEVSGFPYTVELVTLSDEAEETVFQIANIADKGEVSFGEEGADGIYTFGVAGGSVQFNGAGTVSGVKAAEGGTVTFNETAAGVAFAGNDDPAFQIDGANIIIEGAPEEGKTVTYDASDKSLNGFAAGDVTVVDAGVVTKIFAPKGTGDTTSTFTFGEDGDQEIVTASKKGTSFLTVDKDKATGYTFVEVEDAVSADFSDFKLYDGADDTTGFAAPKVTDAEGEAITEATITKVKTGFEIAAEQGYNVEFADGTKLTFETLDAESAAVVFDKTGALVSVTGLTAESDKMIVAGATGAISVDGAAYEITGASWTYQINEDKEVTIRDLTSGVKVVNSGEAVELWSKGGENGTFQFGSASAFTVSGADNDTVEGEAGIQFFWDGQAVTGIASIDENTSVAGALNGLTFNENEEALAITDGTYTVFGGGLSLAGLKNGAEVTKAGGVSNFLTDGSGKFTILSTGMSITDSDGVTFVTDGAELTGIDKLNGMAVGNFEEGFAVNSLSSVKVAGDSSVAVVGDDKTVLAIEELGVADATKEIKVEAAGVSTFGVDQNGLFDFNGSASFGVAGNGKEVTLFDLAKSAIVGVDATETLSGDFSAGYTVDGNEIQVTGDTDISIVGGTQILGLTAGASVAKAAGISVAKTDEEAFTGVFNFGGQSFKVTSVDGVEFQLKDGKVVGISGIGDGENVTGDLNGITMNGKAPEIIVTHKDGTPNTDLYFENGTLSGIVDGDTVVKADNVSTIIASASGVFKFAGGQSFKTSDTDGITFEVKPGSEVEVLAITDLAAGASLEGTLGGLSINTKTVDIKNDDDFGVIGAEGDIGGVYNLSNGAIVNDAAGATVAITDTEGVFTFKGGQSFVTAGDSSVSFTLDKSAVTAVAGLSAGSVFGDFADIKVNDTAINIVDANNNVEVFADAAGKLSKIGQVTGGASIIDAGGVSQIVTDKLGLFNFVSAGQSFTTGDGADVVTFGMSGAKVASISELKGSVEGEFDGIEINGAKLDIVDGDGKLKVFGDGTKLTAIQGVDADATINAAGGVTELVGNISASSGLFTFAGNSGAFTVADDNQITFKLDGASVAKVVGIADLNGSINGNFTGISGINGQTFEVKDADGVLTVYGNGSDITKIADVTGGASIGQVGGVSQILTDKAGEFAFTNGAWSVAGDDEVTFGLSASKVVSISELVGTVSGGFEDITVNGKSVRISGDSAIALVGSASGVSEIQNLTGNAVITAADGISVAKTDSEGAFTFADGRVVNIAGDSAVTFNLDGKGNLVSIDDIETTATVSGDLNGISIADGEKFSVDVNDNLWYNNGTLSGVVDGNTVISADGATTVKVAGDGVYTFANGAFAIAGDSTGVDFLVKDTNIVIGIDGLDENASVTGALNGLTINGGESIVVENDKEFGAVAGDGELAKLFDISNGANVVAAGGASQFVTDEAGDFTILGTKMSIAEDDSVVFTAGASGITAIDDLQGTATGDFTKEIAVNDDAVQVLGDSSIAVTATDDGVESISEVGGKVTVVADGGASAVNTNEVGTFTFQASGQSFVTEGDKEVTFELDGEGSVTGVSNFDQEGTLGFNADIEELAVNDVAMTFDTTTNVSLSLANGEVNYVKGVTDEVSGLENATVEATQAMTVNDTEVDVQDDDKYKIIVADGEVVGLADISGGAKVNFEGELSIAVDSNGELEINDAKYNFNDSIDGAFNLTTNEDGDLASVSEFAGEMVIDEPAEQAFAVNGNELGFVSTADSVTVATDLAEINAVNGLVNGDAIYGDLGNASIAMAGASTTVVAEGMNLNIDGIGYTLLNDADGVSINGAKQVVGLDEGASLVVDTAGDYTVNGSTETADKGSVWVGDEEGNSAYIFDPTHQIIKRPTTVETIEQMFGLPAYDTTFGGDDVDHTKTPNDPSDDPLTKAQTDAIFGPSSTVDINRPLALYATNDEKDTQEIDFSGDDDFSKKVTMYEGDQAVSFGDSGQNFAVVDNAANGHKEINMGNGGDAADVRADKGSVDITGGAGDDTVVVQGSAPVNFDMSAGGADKVITFAKALAKIFLSGYDALANPNAGVTISEKWASLVDAISTGKISFGDNKLIIGETAATQSTVDFGNSFNHFVNLFNYLGEKLAVGFTNSEGGLVDGSASQDPLLLIGNSKGDKTGSSTLLGGASDDTALGGAGDTIDLGAGNNQIDLQDDPNRGGADIVLRLGRTIINGFNGTFNSDHGDNIAADITDAKISFDGTNVVIEGVDFYAMLANVKTDGELSYDLAESADATSTNLLTQSGDYTNVLFNDSTRAAIAKEGGVIDVKVDSTERANTYIGDNSGLTFYGKDGEVLVNLEYGAGSIDTEAVTYEGFNKVAAGDGQTTLIGGEGNETFYAGTGNDSMYGGGGKNLMVGYDDAGNDKTGQTSFFVAAAHDGAANTIQGFNFVDDDNWDVNSNKITADRLDIDVAYHEIRTEEGAVEVSGDDVVITVNNRNNSNVETVVIEGARGKDFLVSGEDGDVIAQVDVDTLVADKFANYFVATGKNASLTVSDDKDNFYIYLGGKPLGTDYEGDVPTFYGDFQVIDARGSNAKAELGGNNSDNAIYAGTGDASLWGGDGGNDLLVGGAGKNTFFYNFGNGNDAIEGVEDGDVIDLTNITLAEISEANISDSGVELKFTDGGSLTVNSTAGEYKVGESTYVVEDGEWKTKE